MTHTTYIKELSQSPQFLRWMVMIFIIIAVIIFFSSRYSHKIVRADLLAQNRKELIDTRFRESVKQQELLCEQENQFLLQLQQVRTEIKYIPYEKEIYRYYGADSVLHIINSAKY